MINVSKKGYVTRPELKYPLKTEQGRGRIISVDFSSSYRLYPSDPELVCVEYAVAWDDQPSNHYIGYWQRGYIEKMLTGLDNQNTNN